MTQEMVIILYAATILGASIILAFAVVLAGRAVAQAIDRATDHEIEVLVAPERAAERFAVAEAARPPQKAT